MSESSETELYDFFRCRGCHRLITRDEVERGLTMNHGKVCTCGSGFISPTDITWQEYVLPNVMEYGLRKLGLEAFRADFLEEMSADGLTAPEEMTVWLERFDQMHSRIDQIERKKSNETRL